MKYAKLLLPVFLISTTAQAHECDDDYLVHNQKVIEMTQSGNSDLARAQRDCLAVQLGRLDQGDDFCPTFRHFQRYFLTLPKAIQINKGALCTEQLLYKNESAAINTRDN